MNASAKAYLFFTFFFASTGLWFLAELWNTLQGYEDLAMLGHLVLYYVLALLTLCLNYFLQYRRAPTAKVIYLSEVQSQENAIMQVANRVHERMAQQYASK